MTDKSFLILLDNDNIISNKNDFIKNHIKYQQYFLDQNTKLVNTSLHNEKYELYKYDIMLYVKCNINYLTHRFTKDYFTNFNIDLNVNSVDVSIISLLYLNSLKYINSGYKDSNSYILSIRDTICGDIDIDILKKTTSSFRDDVIRELVIKFDIDYLKFMKLLFFNIMLKNSKKNS